MNGFCPSLISGSVCLLVCTSVSVAGTPTPATQALLDANSGLRAMFEGQRLVAIYGVPFATDDDPQTTTDDFVTAFLSASGEALGVDNLVLVLDNKINISSDKFTVYAYIQELEDLPVHASVVKIPVLLGATEKIGYAGMHLTQPPGSPLPPDLVSSTAALDVVAQSAEYGHLTDFTTPERVDLRGRGRHRPPRVALHRLRRR